jgi:uncharacterized membrane protein
MNGRLKLALAVSVTLNVFILGAVGGVLYSNARSPTGMAMIGARHGGPLGHAGDALNPADRAAFDRMLHDHIDAARPLLQDARGARREVLDRLSAQPFDRAAAGAALARAGDDELKARTAIEDGILDFAATLDPQEREKLALSLRLGGPFHRGGRPRGPDPEAPPGAPPP